MTMPERHAIWDCGAALDCIGEVAAARAAQAITASGKHVALLLYTKFNVSNLVILWKRRLL